MTKKKDGVKLTVMAIYLPPSTYDDKVSRKKRVTRMMKSLTKELLRRRQAGQRVILAGDLNARIADSCVTTDLQEENQTETWRVNSDKKNNERGKQMMEICEMTGLTMLNGLREEAEWTRKEGAEESVIDWICTSAELTGQAGPVKVLDPDELKYTINSDHRMVWATIGLGQKCTRQERKWRNKFRWDTDDAGSDDHWLKLREEVEGRKPEMENKWVEEDKKETSETAESRSRAYWKIWKDYAHLCLKKGIGRRKKRYNNSCNVYDPMIEQVMLERKQLGKSLKLKKNTPEDLTAGWQRYRHMTRLVRRRARKIRWEKERKRVQRFETMVSTNPREYWRELKKAAGRTQARRAYPSLIKGKHGWVSGTDRDKAWSNAFEILGEEPTQDGHMKEQVDEMAKESGRGENEVMELDGPITIDEVEEAVKRLKAGKAQGVDGIPTELMMKGGDAMIQTLHTLVEKIWELEVVPDDWSEGLVVPIYKDAW